MRRYWLSGDAKKEAGFLIEGEKFKHIFGVCRQEVGSKFEVLIGDGFAYFVEVKLVSKKSAEVHVLETRKVDAIHRPYIHLLVSHPKPAKLDEIIEKSVELGVRSVTPFLSDYSYFKSMGPKLEKRVERWSKIVKAATEQCGRSEIMEVRKCVSLDKCLESFNRESDALGLFPYEGESELAIKDALSGRMLKNPKDVWVFVGSEGGFSKREVERFQGDKLSPVTLGRQILRVETACVAIVSVIKYELDLMK